MIKIKTEMVPKKFVYYGDSKVELSDMMLTLIVLSEEDITRIYEIPSKSAIKILESEGIVTREVGEKQCVIYRVTDKFDDFYEKFMEIAN